MESFNKEWFTIGVGKADKFVDLCYDATDEYGATDTCVLVYKRYPLSDDLGLVIRGLSNGTVEMVPEEWKVRILPQIKRPGPRWFDGISLPKFEQHWNNPVDICLLAPRGNGKYYLFHGRDRLIFDSLEMIWPNMEFNYRQAEAAGTKYGCQTFNKLQHWLWTHAPTMYLFSDKECAFLDEGMELAYITEFGNDEDLDV